ncbi:carboxymuconolactone decarboxylase family protein [Pueribacillus theae]|uniref:Carboxymuconolactone decarboxylase family protein n=1 Tax=Pueribacillus theae TaxID=2171751 RepID=A0A2U1JPN7_9BACI|nr:carboxymuconolactone decarboxylase family protein [Pueribacillus theae]PWA07131.1 carboxymuconolactone decarboxylase family protein [Pueribacillus theae]
MEMNDNESVNYFDQSITDFKQGSSRLSNRLPEITQGYFDFTEACFREGAISKKHKQLTALSISIYAQDEYCIIYHTKGAVDHGATEEELMEAIAISAALGGGTAFSQGVTLAMDTFDHYNQTST